MPSCTTLPHSNQCANQLFSTVLCIRHCLELGNRHRNDFAIISKKEEAQIVSTYRYEFTCRFCPEQHQTNPFRVDHLVALTLCDGCLVSPCHPTSRLNNQNWRHIHFHCCSDNLMVRHVIESSCHVTIDHKNWILPVMLPVRSFS